MMSSYNNINNKVIKELTNSNGDFFQGQMGIFKGNTVLEETTHYAELLY